MLSDRARPVSFLPEIYMGNFINNAPFALVIVFLIIGFVLLIKGADFFVEGSSSVAKV